MADMIVCVGKEVRKLTGSYQALQATLMDAEDRQGKGNVEKNWLDKLKDVAYEIEDVLEEWNTAIGKLQIKEAENASKPLRKVCHLISYCLCCCSRLAFRFDIAFKIEILNRKLDLIGKEKAMFLVRFNEYTENLERPVTTSAVNVLEVHGRDQDKNTLVNLLLSKSSPGANLSIISIVGMGGIGKTTLAQIAFNDDKVKSHFDKKIWVCVSNPFDEIRIARAVLNSLDVSASNLGQLEPLLERIRKSIEGNKFLLVLDDMWIDSPKIWEEFKHSLRYGSQGSRILVTTCKTNVANIMETTNMMKLETLSEDESWSLFSQVAFSKRSAEECKRLENIGKTIVGKCRGLPHAIKTLGSILRFRSHVEWESVLDDDLWKLDEIGKDLFLPFLFSYYDLPPKLRNCFLYCAIFPKGYEIRKHKLIDLWMAQGYLKKERNVNMELVGEEYFETLAMRFFFRDFELDGGITKCKMHDLMLDFAQYLGKNECFSIEVDGHVVSRLELSHKRPRHLTVTGNWIPNSIYDEKALRSLIVNTTVDLKVRADLPKLFDRFTCLRSLDLSSFSIEEFPRGIQKLVHLRYLNLSENKRLKELPEELCDLYHLETLDLSGCSYIQKIPRRIGKLINLRHLINLNTFNISYMRKGIESLTCLRTLSEFIVCGGGHDNKACTLACLRYLNHLQGFLTLKRLGNVTDINEVKQAELKSKNRLLYLRLSFYKLQDIKKRKTVENEVVLEALEPPHCLEKLTIEDYISKTMSPIWMASLTKLRELMLYKCMNCEHLPPLGKLSSLESLSIWYMGGVKKVGNEFLGIESGGTLSSSSAIVAFPKLKYLSINYMEEWEEWEEWNYEFIEEDVLIMPSLCSLQLNMCCKLKTLPEYLLQMTTLEELRIKYCHVLNLEKIWLSSYTDDIPLACMRMLSLDSCMNVEYLPPMGKLSFLESIIIKRMNRVKRVSNEFLGIQSSGSQRSITVFPKLKILVFENMDEWEEWDITIGDEELTIMPSLQFVTIQCCNKLKGLPDHLLQAPRLEQLTINRCSILKERYRGETAEDWTKICHIPNIQIHR